MESWPACLVCLLRARFKGESVLVLSVLHYLSNIVIPFPFAVLPLFLFFFFVFFLNDLCQIVLP
jgi:hypothetical protein